MCVTLFFVAALLSPSLAHRIGAQANESCYGHEIDHRNPENPPAFKQDCVLNCNYDLTLEARILNNGTEVEPGSYLTCGENYKCKYNYMRGGRGLL